MTRQEFSLFETSWAQLGEIALSAVLVYVAIIIVVRINGPRITSQLNSFDWIINVMVGSLAASGVLLENVSILEAFFAICCLALLQFVLTKLTERYEIASDVVKARPLLLTHKGEYLEDAMRRSRISKEEILSHLRRSGYGSLDETNWVILEPNGRLTILPHDPDLSLEKCEALKRVRKPEELQER